MEPEFRVHPVCDLFPLMDDDALARFCADIRKNGLIHPIVLHDGQIVDGRNRLRACQETGIKPRFIQWRDVYQGTMSLAQWIWSQNVERRHLTKDQIAAAITARKAIEEQEAARQNSLANLKQNASASRRDTDMTKSSCRTNPLKTQDPAPQSTEICAPPPQPTATKDQVATAITACKTPEEVEAVMRRQHPSPVQPTPPPVLAQPSGSVRSRLAKEAGVSEYQIQRALNIQKANPDLLKDVAHGKITAQQAEAKIKNTGPNKRQQIIENAAKHRMIAGLSHIRGCCRGLRELDVNKIRNQCTPEEIKTWARDARESATVLRRLAAALLQEEK
jgi:hypothetical protein